MSEREARISLQVHPNAARNEIGAPADGVWQVKVAAPPVEGRANRELIAFLRRRLGVRKSALKLVMGHSSRNKVIAVNGLSQAEITQRLLPKASR
jgi:uncharacterized protein (TIGR00251 family)